jgi:anti-sigma factor RsiW
MIGRNAIDLMCKEVVELVSEYLGNTLDAANRVRFEKHLLTCPPCTDYLAQMRTTLAIASGRGLEKAPPSTEVQRELVTLFRRWHGK